MWWRLQTVSIVTSTLRQSSIKSFLVDTSEVTLCATLTTSVTNTSLTTSRKVRYTNLAKRRFPIANTCFKDVALNWTNLKNKQQHHRITIPLQEEYLIQEFDHHLLPYMQKMWITIPGQSLCQYNDVIKTPSLSSSKYQLTACFVYSFLEKCTYNINFNPPWPFFMMHSVSWISLDMFKCICFWIK